MIADTIIDMNGNQVKTLVLENLAAVPTAKLTAGRVYFDTAAQAVKVYDGTSFVTLQDLEGLGTAAYLNGGTAAGNVPVLDAGGKLVSAVIPQIAISVYLGSVTAKADLVTFSAGEQGDWANVETGTESADNGSYLLNGVYSDLTAWIKLASAGAVYSVNGKTGTVVLSYTDVGAIPVNAMTAGTYTKVTVNQYGVVTASAALTADDLPALPESKVTGLVADLASKVDENTPITAGTYPKITYDAKGLVTAGAALVKTDIPNIDEAQVTGLTADLNDRALQTDLTAHLNDVANPHAVTKAQVGLGNADNTADLNKPVSTAVQAALDGKVDENAAITANTSAYNFPSYDTKGLITGKVAQSYNQWVVLNGTTFHIMSLSAVNWGAFFAPVVAGTAGQLLASAGSGAPAWQTLDTAPTASSTKAVTSGGIKTALDDKAATADLGTAAYLDTGHIAATVPQLQAEVLDGQALVYSSASGGFVGSAQAAGLAVESYTVTGDGSAVSFTHTFTFAAKPYGLFIFDANGKQVDTHSEITATAAVLTFNTAPASGTAYQVNLIGAS